jgi:hypothetical protein
VSASSALYAGPACPHCAAPLEVAAMMSGRQTCPRCRRGFEAVRFDPPPPDLAVKPLAQAGPDAAQACAHHAGNAAETHCGRCGVFMCALCRIEADAKVLCPACFERLSDEAALPSTIATYRDYSRLAGLLALLGLVPFIGPVAGVGSVYYAVQRLGQMSKNGETDGRIGLIAVMGLAVVEIVGGAAFIVWMVRS